MAYWYPWKHTHTTGTLHKYCVTTWSLTPALKTLIGATTIQMISSSSPCVHLSSQRPKLVRTWGGQNWHNQHDPPACGSSYASRSGPDKSISDLEQNNANEITSMQSGLNIQPVTVRKFCVLGSADEHDHVYLPLYWNTSWASLGTPPKKVSVYLGYPLSIVWAFTSSLCITCTQNNTTEYN